MLTVVLLWVVIRKARSELKKTVEGQENQSIELSEITCHDSLHNGKVSNGVIRTWLFGVVESLMIWFIFGNANEALTSIWVKVVRGRQFITTKVFSSFVSTVPIFVMQFFSVRLLNFMKEWDYWYMYLWLEILVLIINEICNMSHQSVFLSSVKDNNGICFYYMYLFEQLSAQTSYFIP